MRARPTNFPKSDMEEAQPLLGEDHNPDNRLGELGSTSISGNDIGSSCFYVVGISAFYAGLWAPVAVFLVSFVLLYALKNVYLEVITALPLNGGTYTVLLNSTSKSIAAIAGSLTLLSYTAAAVVSSAYAVSYAQYFVDIPTGLSVLAVLGFFAMLSLLGLKDSSRFATVVFVFHVTVISSLIIHSMYWVCFVDNFTILRWNWNHAYDSLPGGEPVPWFFEAVLFGFASAMLGITGFETSANYVEQQRPGVFPKTLFNMWMLVAIVNPLLSLLSFATLMRNEVMGYPLLEGLPQNEQILTAMAKTPLLKTLVSIDACVVLSGAVLTCFVGVVGLTHRMALDRCFPSGLLSENRLFGTFHIIITIFSAACISLYFLTGQNVYGIANVFALSFLMVLALFTCGNLILGYKRPELRRIYNCPRWLVFLVLGLLILAIYTNFVINTVSLPLFFGFYGAISLAIVFMFKRVELLRIAIRSLASVHSVSDIDSSDVKGFNERVVAYLSAWYERILSIQVVFFIKENSMSVLNQVVSYVRVNEKCTRIMFIHIGDQDPEYIACLSRDLKVLQSIYPLMSFEYKVMSHTGGFSGSAVSEAQLVTGIPKHLMFVGCPNKDSPDDIASLGGVRIITIDSEY